MTVIAKFHPQVWINDHAVDADPEGETSFDVTEAIEAMGREKALLLDDNEYESDELRELPGAPAWVRDWSGPFWVEVKASIAEHFGEEV